MIEHGVRVHRSSEQTPQEAQLAWKIATVAADSVPIEHDVAEMVVNRVIDNAGVALGRRPVASARSQALRHPMPPGSTVLGCDTATRISPEWAAWANGVAVRELDFHDTFLAEEYAHPGDNIPALFAVAQHAGRTGMDLLRAIVTAYEIQIDLSRAVSLHRHKIDHVAHLGPSIAAGIGTLLELSATATFEAIGQALHLTTSTRQSRKGRISSWKAYAPAFAAKVAIEAVDRAMRGEQSPSPIYEGEDGVIAQLLDGPDAEYHVPLPAPGEPKRAILASFTKEYSAEYQAQAFIDLAKRLRTRIADLAQVKSITLYTSHHTHCVIGSGANDPQKLDPDASRETLNHSIMYIFAVALEDGTWHELFSYTPERAHRPTTIDLWHKISTHEDTDWTKRYLSHDPKEQAFGGRAVVVLHDGSTVEDELALANAHPRGAAPFDRSDYLAKFRRLAEDVVPATEQERFLNSVLRLPSLTPEEVRDCNFAVPGLQDSTPLGGLI